MAGKWQLKWVLNEDRYEYLKWKKLRKTIRSSMGVKYVVVIISYAGKDIQSK